MNEVAPATLGLKYRARWAGQHPHKRTVSGLGCLCRGATGGGSWGLASHVRPPGLFRSQVAKPGAPVERATGTSFASADRCAGRGLFEAADQNRRSRCAGISCALRAKCDAGGSLDPLSLPPAEAAMNRNPGGCLTRWGPLPALFPSSRAEYSDPGSTLCAPLAVLLRTTRKPKLLYAGRPTRQALT